MLQCCDLSFYQIRKEFILYYLLQSIWSIKVIVSWAVVLQNLFKRTKGPEVEKQAVRCWQNMMSWDQNWKSIPEVYPYFSVSGYIAFLYRTYCHEFQPKPLYPSPESDYSLGYTDWGFLMMWTWKVLGSNIYHSVSLTYLWAIHTGRIHIIYFITCHKCR